MGQRGPGREAEKVRGSCWWVNKAGSLSPEGSTCSCGRGSAGRCWAGAGLVLGLGASEVLPGPGAGTNAYRACVGLRGRSILQADAALPSHARLSKQGAADPSPQASSGQVPHGATGSVRGSRGCILMKHWKAEPESKTGNLGNPRGIKAF